MLVFASAAELALDATVIGGAGTDTIRMDTGTDALALVDTDFTKVTQVETLALNGTGTQAVTLGTKTDAAFATGITVTTQAGATSLNLQGSASTVSINATGTNGADTMVGGTVADTLVGGNGADTITGNGGADSLVGGAGNDRFDFANVDFNGGDTVAGGGDTDTIRIIDAALIVDADFTNVTSVEELRLANVANSVTLGDLAALAGIATVVGGTNDDTLTLTDTVAASDISGVRFESTEGSDTFNIGGLTVTGVLALDGLDDTLIATTGANISALNAGINNGVTTAETLSLTGGITMTLAQHEAFTTISAGSGNEVGEAVDSVTLTTSGTFVGRADVEVYNLSNNAGNVFTQVAGNTSVVGGTGNDVIRTSGTDTARGDLTINLTAGGTDTVLLQNAAIGNNGASSIVGGLGGSITTNATSFAFTDNTNVVTVTSAGHGLFSGDIVRFGATINGPNRPGGGGETDVVVVQNADYAVTVINTDTFTISAAGLEADLDAQGVVNTSVAMTRANGVLLNNTIERWEAAGLNEGIDYATINGFSAGNGGDRIAYLLGSTATVVGGYADNVNLDTNNLAGLAPNSVIEIQSNFQINDGTNLGAVATMLDRLNGVQDGTYYIVIYDGTSANSNAWIYVATATEGDGFDFADVNGATNGYDTDTLELLAVLNNVGADALTSQNFVSSIGIVGG